MNFSSIFGGWDNKSRKNKSRKNKSRKTKGGADVPVAYHDINAGQKGGKKSRKNKNKKNKKDKE